MTSQAPTVPQRPVYLRFLPAYLFKDEGPAAVYVVKTWLLALLPSFLLSSVVGWMMPDAEPPALSFDSAGMIVMIVLIAPFLETLILAAILLGLNRLIGAGPAAVLSALLWAIAHSLSAPIWGLVIWWPFLVMSVAYLTWNRQGFWKAVLLVTAVHAMQNGTATLLVLAMR